MSNVGGPELLVVLIGLVPLGLVIWGLVDAAGRPQEAWEAAGQSKTLWIVLQAVGLVFCGIGAILAIVYLLAIRPQVAAQQGRAPGF